MKRSAIAYSTDGWSRVQQLCERHCLNVVELFESLAFADDEIVANAIAQGLPRRKEKMSDNKKVISQAKRAVKLMSSEQLAALIQSQQSKA